MQCNTFDPTRGRLLAVGDIHGYLDKLRQLLEDQVQPTTDDRVVFLGDYIDRGPDSKGVVSYLINFAQQFPKSIFLRGNHEQMLLDTDLINSYQNIGDMPRDLLKVVEQRCETIGCRLRQMENVFIGNGGDKTIVSYLPELADQPRCSIDYHPDLLPQDHRTFLQATQLMHLEQIQGMRYLFVHAGIYPKYKLERQDYDDLLWIRDLFLKNLDYLPDDLVVIHGHTPAKELTMQSFGGRRFHQRHIMLDSGVHLPEKEGMGKLSCCDLLARTFWQV